MPSARAAAVPKFPFAGGPVKLTRAGQHKYETRRCIATQLDGSPCGEPWAQEFVPYCAQCMKEGDPSLAVVPHPRFGKCLIAKRDLPKGYHMALFGEVFDQESMPEADKEWGFETVDGVFVNPVHEKASAVQFCQCPGPNEKITVEFADPHILLEDEPTGKKKRKHKYGSMLFETQMKVPKDHQLVMMYAENEKAADTFFTERGMERCDVWAEKYPTILKAKKKIENLKLEMEEKKAMKQMKKARAKDAGKNKKKRSVMKSNDKKGKSPKASQKTPKAKGGAKGKRK
eukprot:CAMPEP_0178992092 /NCGR_PEP_ID=MMETSP0795-20121207/5908_1 /TAXON_ID=88552 /ORGANISM="Amoebophrya sp., Strain Ameob2" /LENGTH=286 /DNA_ID=CAMNT_0020683907 /DNA_START=272 /DNA_END=1132 /DNA_ORIENTATION=-